MWPKRPWPKCPGQNVLAKTSVAKTSYIPKILLFGKKLNNYQKMKQVTIIVFFAPSFCRNVIPLLHFPPVITTDLVMVGVNVCHRSCFSFSLLYIFISISLVLCSIPLCDPCLTHSHTTTPFDAPGKQAL